MSGTARGVALLFLLAPLLSGAPFPPGQIKSGDKKWQAAAANYRTLLRYQVGVCYSVVRVPT
jgi:hypothetical protein